MEEKTVAQSLKEELFLDNKNGYFKISEKDEENIENFAKRLR